jgi:hypothetical protein
MRCAAMLFLGKTPMLMKRASCTTTLTTMNFVGEILIV